MILYKDVQNYVRSSESDGSLTLHEAKLLFHHVTAKQMNPVDAPTITDEEYADFKALTERRKNGEPLQYLLGKWPFLDFEVKVDRRALIPRPETELLAQLAAAEAKRHPGSVIADLCAGTGVISFAIERAAFPSVIKAVEISSDACSLMDENRTLLSSSIVIIHADAAEYLEKEPDDSLDLVVSNPPYVSLSDYEENYDELRFEPEIAFLADENGLAFYRSFSPLIYRKLKHGGSVFYEIGEEQSDAVRSLLCESGFRNIRTYSDFQNIDRVISAQKD